MPLSYRPMFFSQIILLWYSGNKRPLPWRNTTDPYKIWLSEIILQQTRVAQGLPYYHKFITAFPTLQDLANAGETDILKHWQGLGYYTRARNMHKTAIAITRDMGGRFPETYEGLLQLKGVGDYTASAIASCSFNLPEPVVDGNVYRVLARYFGIQLPINSGEGKKYFKQLARAVMDTGRIADYNQGIMEFGAIQCVPQKPDCGQCPLNTGCIALKDDMVAQLPVKLNKVKVKKRYFNYLVLLDPDYKTRLTKREGKGIWQNLFEFPLMETEKELDLPEFVGRLARFLGSHEISDVQLANTDKIIHKLTHQHLDTRFWIIRTEDKLRDGLSIQQIRNYPVPVLLAEFIKTL